MSLARVKTRCRQGLSAPLVSVEIHLSAGLPTIALVGFSEATVRDAKERVRSAILSTGFRWPDSRITISISPAALQKTGAGFDLPIAVAILIASKQLPSSLADSAEFFGELSLDGRVLETRGLLAAVASERDADTVVYTPEINADALFAVCPNLVGLTSLKDLKHPDQIENNRPRANAPQDRPPLSCSEPARRTTGALASIRNRGSRVPPPLDVGRTGGRKDHGGRTHQATASKAVNKRDTREPNFIGY